MGGVLTELGKKLADRWFSLLVLPGALYLAVLAVAGVLGHAHALDAGRLDRRIGQWAGWAATRTSPGLAVALLAALLGSAAAGLAAQALGALAEQLSLAEDWDGWPPPLRHFAAARVRARRGRWETARGEVERARERLAESHLPFGGGAHGAAAGAHALPVAVAPFASPAPVAAPTAHTPSAAPATHAAPAQFAPPPPPAAPASPASSMAPAAHALPTPSAAPDAITAPTPSATPAAHAAHTLPTPPAALDGPDTPTTHTAPALPAAPAANTAHVPAPSTAPAASGTPATPAAPTPGELLSRAERAKDRIAQEQPARPTWSGDRVQAAATRIEREYRIDLATVWPALWLTLPKRTRHEVADAREALTRATTLTAWGLLYLIAGLLWWPALLIGVVVIATGWHRIRTAADTYALLLEATVRLHGAALAKQLGVGDGALLTPKAGAAVTWLLQGRSNLLQLTADQAGSQHGDPSSN